MCGIIGIVGSPSTHVATSVYDGLIVLQHRGQDAAGIVTSDSENICHRRANGLVLRMRHNRSTPIPRSESAWPTMGI